MIAADAATETLAAALQREGIDPMQPDGDGRVAVVRASLAKGLEYDHVVVVEPASSSRPNSVD